MRMSLSFRCACVQRVRGRAMLRILSRSPTRNMVIYRILKKYLHLVLDNSTVWVIFVRAFKTCLYYYVSGQIKDELN